MKASSPAIALIIALVLWCGHAGAVEYSWSELAGMKPGQTVGRDSGEGDRSLDGQWGRWRGDGEFDEMWLSLVGEENQGAWTNFQNTPTTIIPLAAVRFYIDYRTLKPLEGAPPLRAGSEGPQAGQGPPVTWRLPTSYGSNKDGDVGLGAVPTGRGWSAGEWLFEGEGIFSGTPWSWDNLFLRLFTVTFGLVGILLLIEGLRVIMTLGLKMAGTLARRRQS